MTTLRWDDVAEEFAPDGSLRDIYVFGVSTDDWRRVIDMVSRRWVSRYSEGGDDVPVRSARDVFAFVPLLLGGAFVDDRMRA